MRWASGRRGARGLASIFALALLVAAAGCTSQRATGRRVIVLGFDGLDYDVTRQLISAGRLPSFARLAAHGGFSRLGTTVPPQSPVAWSTFMTGQDPGEHGIFDFVHRDPTTMLPYLSTTRSVSAGWTLPLGRWQVPLSSGTVELLRRGQPFWDVLEAHGVPATVIRMPANFPPSGTASRELSGMGTPDVLGGYGTFSFYTSQPEAFVDSDISGGVVRHVRVRDGRVQSTLTGPDNPFLRRPRAATAAFAAYPDVSGHYAKVVVGGEERLLAVGEWSDWVPVEFPLAPTQTLHAEVRFFLKGLDPYFELYASPVNLDPMAPAMPISHPARFARELAEATGRFYTQGMPEDTKGLGAGVLSDEQFLKQASIAAEENRTQYRYILKRFRNGFLFYYFGNVDQVSHMMWRARDPEHPAYDPVTDAANATVIEDLYRGLDALVGETLDRLGPDDLLVVMSDHGFTSWRRTFHLNSWLRDNGYIVLKDASRRDDPGLFGNVDWTRTRAYALGLNGLYVNVQGREKDGVVPPSRRLALVEELTSKLLGVVDPATGKPAVTHMYRREDVYTMAGMEGVAPDLVVGYAKGTRGSDESALGGLPPDVFANNTSHWNGDHCMDPEAVPGILLSSRPLRTPAPTLQRLAPALLAEFGISGFPRSEE